MTGKIKITLLFLFVLASRVAFSQLAHPQSFDGTTFPPTGWTANGGTYSSTTYLNRVTSSTSVTVTPHTGAALCRFRCTTVPTTNSGNLFTPKIDYSNRGASTPTVSFWVYRDVTAAYNSATYNAEGVNVYVNTSTSSSFTGATLLGFIPRRGGLAASGTYLTTSTNLTVAAAGWYQYSFDIPAGFTACAYIGLKFVSNQGLNTYIDDIDYTSYPNLPGCAGISSPSNNGTGYSPINPSLTLNWNAPSGCSEFTSYKLYLGTDAGATNIINGTNVGLVNTYTPSTLLANTRYYWKVVPTSGAGDASGCTTWSFTTGIATPCTAGSCCGGGNDIGGTPYDFITDVAIGSPPNAINRSYGFYEGYSNTGLSSNVYIGTAYPLTIYTTGNQWNYCFVYVDWNQDGDFGDASETIASYISGTWDLSTLLTPPAGALAGSTTMRIMQMDDDDGWFPPSPLGCGDVGYGEVEDYILTVCNTQITTQPAASYTTCASIGSRVIPTVVSGATSLQWQYSANGTTGWANVANNTPAGANYSGANTATLTVSSITTGSTTHYYRLNASTTACTATSNTTSLLVRTISTDPTSLTAPQYTICPGNSTTLTINGGSRGYAANWKWYTGSCGGTLVATNTSGILSVTPAVTTTYYARAEGACNNTACVSATIVVGGAPTTNPVSATATSPICLGGTATLTVTNPTTIGAGSAWVWYSGSCGGTYVGTGNPLIFSPTVTATYYGRAEGCNITSCVSRSITVNTIPTCTTLNTPYNGQSGLCRRPTLTWNAASGATSYKVYVGTAPTATNVINGTNVGNTTGYSIPTTLTANTLHYWKIVPTNSCGDAIGCTTRSFTTGTEICYCTATTCCGGGQDGSSVPYDYISDVYVGTVPMVRNSGYDGYAYTGQSMNALVGNAYTLDVYMPGNQGNYVSAYVDWNQDGDFQDGGETLINGTWHSSHVATTFTVSGSATIGHTTLRIMQWDDEVGVGYAPSPAGCGDVNVGDVEDYELIVCNTRITTQPASSYTLCASIGTQTLSAVTSGATSHQWEYSANGSTGWSSVANNTPAGAVYSGANTATMTVSGITTGATNYYYRLKAISVCTEISNTTALVVRTISTDPTSLTAPQYTICPGASTTLTINGGSRGHNANWKWYTGSCGGTLVATNTTGILSVTPAVTTAYYARAEGTCNNTACVSATIVVGGSPSSNATGISTSTTTICNGTSATLTATGGTLGAWATWTWYTGSCGGTLVGTGNPIAVSPTVTTGYYVRAEGCNTTSCPGPRNITVTNIPACNTLLLPGNGWGNQCRNPTLTYSVSAGATAYKVYVGTNAAANNIINGLNVGNVTSYIVPTLAANTLHYWKIVPLNVCGDATGPCTIRSFTTGDDVCYCEAKASLGGGQDGQVPPVDHDFISSVYIGTINRNSGYDYYYNTGLTSNAVVGTSYPLYVYTPANQWNYVSAYADWNQDGDFQDANETIMNNVSGTWDFSATVTPPAGAAFGNTTLRIMQWDDNDGSAPSPAGCGDVYYGDVEDYTLIVCNTVITSQPSNASYCAGGTANFSCSATGASSYQWQRNQSGTWVNVANGTPTGAVYTNANTPTMTVSGVTATGYTYYRCAVTGACTFFTDQKYLYVNAVPACNALNLPADLATAQCRNLTLTWNYSSNTSGYKFYLGTDPAATNIINGVNQGYIYQYKSVFAANTTYYWKVVPWNGCGDAVGCAIRSFTTGPSVCYCTPSASYGPNYIENVTMGSINNNSGSNTYIDYSAQTTQVLIGYSYNLTVTSQTDSINNFCRAFVDWNQDGDFSDAGELVLDGQNDDYYSITVIPPVGAVGGTTRLRIMLSDEYYGYNSPDGCGNIYQGEIEDYRLNVCGVSISTQPANNAACVNIGSGNLSVTAVAATSYQWQYYNTSWNNVANGLPGGSVYTNATTATMNVAGINSVGNYEYRCNVIGTCTITSSPCTLTVISGVPGLASYTFPGNGATNQCSNSYTSLNWTAASNSPAGYKLYFGTDAAATNIVNGTNIGNVLTYNPLPLANNTTYYWKIVPTNNCGDASGAFIRSFTTGTVCYCVPNYTYDACGLNMHISNFTTTGGASNITNTSGCASAAASYYADYSASYVSLISGNAFSFSVSQPSVNYNTGFRIWIDFNGDFDFADAGEDVWNSGSIGKTFSGTIVVPAGTSPGTKRMRIRNKYASVPLTTDYCSTLNYGETEDYSVVVVAPCVAPTTQASSITFSGIVCDQMTVSWTSGNGSKRILVAKAGSAVTGNPSNSTTYSASSVFGSGGFITAGEYVVYNGTSNSVTLTGLTQGVTYYFKIFEYNCTPGWEEFLITSPPSASQVSSAPSAPNAGADQYICSPNTTTTMAASGPGTWSFVSGPNTPNIDNTSSATTQIGTSTGLIQGTYVFRWSGTCGGTYDDVRIIRQ